MTSHGGAFCIKSVKQPKLDANVPCVKDFDFGHCLASVYPLLDIVFKYLTFMDLRACSEVNQSWKEVAERVLAKRRTASWFTCYRVGYKSRKANIMAHSSNLNFNNVEMGVILYDCNRIKLNKYICLHDASTLSRKTVPEYIEEELVPNSVDYCLLAVPRVVSYFNVERTTKDIQDHGSVFDGLFIPKIPNIRTIMFHCNPSKKKELEDTARLYIRPEEEVKCLLLFCKKQLHGSLYNILDCLVPKDNPNRVALGGGVIHGTKTFQRLCAEKKIYTVKDTVCVTFLKERDCVSDNFRAYSCVIKGSDLTKAEFDSELEEFKQNVSLKNHSLGFRICCSAKYQDVEELQSFPQIFPGIPLLGLEAYGEIGWNTFHKEDTSGPKKSKRLRHSRDYPHAENFWSTIFVLVTWD
ncbi:uncharacterized protein LOC132697767 [Cylas formicarius]|uniref:uncharacterized protein LOC132697767 n=1 Tax=Cylas formicarius TaxID=197179 RepID=UPI0029587E07|nr:uncharacterized protein LOC132697767 [Cylas formicarius]